MNKSELIAQVATETGLTKKDMEKALSGIINCINGALAKGEEITLVGFGTFKVGNRAERSGRNPKTGAALTIPAKKTPRFLPGKVMKEAVTG